MRGRVQRPATPVRPERQPSLFADAQIQHLEFVVKCATQADGDRILCLDLAYWRRRVLMLEDTYDLVPSQALRLKALLRLLNCDQDTGSYGWNRF
jgi:hypothetical protein